MPILKQQPGFIDEIVLIAHAESDRVLALSFWNNQEDAERYRRYHYRTIHYALRHLFETEPDIHTFDVHTSLGHNIAEEKAA